MGVLFGLGVALVLACGSDKKDDNQFRTDVISCEEALARLSSCCPNFDAQPVECNYYYYYDDGCGVATTQKVEPAFTEAESECVRDTPCEVLRSSGVCTRAALARSPSFSSTVETTSSTSTSSSSGSIVRGPAVCP